MMIKKPEGKLPHVMIYQNHTKDWILKVEGTKVEETLHAWEVEMEEI